MLERAGASASRPDDLGPEFGLHEGSYRLSEAQAQAILELRLQRLTGLEQRKIEDEYREVMDAIAAERRDWAVFEVDAQRDAALTSEFEVFHLFGEGRTAKEIGNQLGISAKTASVHRDHIKAKMGYQTSAEMIREAVRWVEAHG